MDKPDIEHFEYRVEILDASSLFSTIERELQVKGVKPDDLVFRFQCQECGLRCCLNQKKSLGIIFQPFSFANIRQVIPKEVLAEFFKLRLLEWVILPNPLPFVMVRSFVCPFLMLHWNPQIKELFQENLKAMPDSKSPALQLFLVHTLHALTTIYYDNLRERGVREETLAFNVNFLVPTLMNVWDQLAYDYPDLFAEGSKEEYVIAFYEFLQHPPKRGTLYQATCKIWPVRPEICRVYPLHRQMLLKTGETDYQDEKVLLQKGLCPPHAFQKGGAKTAEYYLRQQRVTNAEEIALAKIKATVQQYEELLKDTSFGDLASFHLELGRQLYYSTDYFPPPEAFYQRLQDNLNEFFQDFIEKNLKLPANDDDVRIEVDRDRKE